jgi:hypothetical protein
MGIVLLPFRTPALLLELFEALAPRHCPEFALCWLQLVGHRGVFPRLAGSNDERALRFCVGFVIACIHLSIEAPDAFYPAIARILLTLAELTPGFFVAYHALIVEGMPARFVQFRNIILGAAAEQDDGAPPPVGFAITDALEGRAVRTAIDAYRGDNASSPARLVATFLRNAVAGGGDTTPVLVWQFALYCIAKGADVQADRHIRFPSWQFSRLAIVDLVCTVCGALDGEALLSLIGAICDNVRFPNMHTKFATGLIVQIFERAGEIAKEVVLTVLIKRMMCVTQPPAAVVGILAHILANFGKEIERILSAKGEWDIFRKAQTVREIVAEGSAREPR